MSSFEMVLLIVLGDVVQQGITQEDTSIGGAILAASTLTLLVISTGYLAFRFRSLRTFIDGRPTVLIHDGQVVKETLRIERLTTEELMAELRQHGIEDVGTVRLGALEADGRFSFLTVDTFRAPPDTSRL